MGGRLECTMQNIADNFSNKFTSRCQGSLEGKFIWISCNDLCIYVFKSLNGTYSLNMILSDKLDTFIVYNERRRVTSSAKKKKPHASAALHQVIFLKPLSSLLFFFCLVLCLIALIWHSMKLISLYSVTSKLYFSSLQTPDGALLDILRNAYDLLTECDIKLPMVSP